MFQPVSTPASPAARRSMGRLALAALATTGLLALAGCAKPPPPVVSDVSLILAAGADVNPDARKRPSPVTVRVYALKSPASFESADFFSLYDKDSATLGADLTQKEELLLRPGETKPLKLQLAADVKAVAIMAAFRDLEHARWREVHVLDVGKPVEITARLNASRISLEKRALPPIDKK